MTCGLPEVNNGVICALKNGNFKFNIILTIVKKIINKGFFFFIQVGLGMGDTAPRFLLFLSASHSHELPQQTQIGLQVKDMAAN